MLQDNIAATTIIDAIPQSMKGTTAESRITSTSKQVYLHDLDGAGTEREQAH